MQSGINSIAASQHPVVGDPPKSERCAGSRKFLLINGILTPLLAPLMQNRRLNGIFTIFGISQLLLVYTGFAGWQCPIYGTLGIICPGCGMSTALKMLIKGQWQLAIQIHAFAPIVLLGLVTLLIAAVLSDVYLSKLAAIVERLERKSGLTAILLTSMVMYWLLRIFDFI